MALPKFRVSDGSAFGSMPDVELQQLEVRPVLALRTLALPMCHTAKHLQSCCTSPKHPYIEAHHLGWPSYFRDAPGNRPPDRQGIHRSHPSTLAVLASMRGCGAAGDAAHACSQRGKLAAVNCLSSGISDLYRAGISSTTSPAGHLCCVLLAALLALRLSVAPGPLQGDNRGDAMRLATHALEALGTKGDAIGRSNDLPSRWVVPPSWIVFGQQNAVY